VTAVSASLIDFTDFTLGGGNFYAGEFSIKGG
jgi:hypothetical protein